MIEKKIHYCWVGGGALPDLAVKCIDSWKEFCPDYEIFEWNESNYDFTKNKYMKEAYEAKKWGFVPDYARLDIIYELGGIYLDTDVEIIKSFDDLLSHSAFMGMERPGYVALGLGFGAEPGNELIRELRDYYDNISFINKNGSLNTIASPRLQTEVLKRHGYNGKNVVQKIEKAIIFPSEYFCPISLYTGKTEITKNTYSIHHFMGSWQSPIDKIIMNLSRRFDKRKRISFLMERVVTFPFRLIRKCKQLGVTETLKYAFMRMKGNPDK